MAKIHQLLDVVCAENQNIDGSDEIARDEDDGIEEWEEDEDEHDEEYGGDDQEE